MLLTGSSRSIFVNETCFQRESSSDVAVVVVVVDDEWKIKGI
jgi:hypothetical protein